MAASEAQDGELYRESTGRLLVEIAHRLRILVGPRFGAAGLKPRQVDLLRTLARRESTTQQQLVEALGVDPSVLVGLLNELERDGAIRRIRDPRDRRRHLVEISAPGLAALKTILADVEQAELEILAVLTPQEDSQLRQLLAKVRAGLDPGSDAGREAGQEARDCDRQGRST